MFKWSTAGLLVVVIVLLVQLNRMDVQNKKLEQHLAFSKQQVLDMESQIFELSKSLDEADKLDFNGAIKQSEDSIKGALKNLLDGVKEGLDDLNQDLQEILDDDESNI